jgi:hypothetical protein
MRSVLGMGGGSRGVRRVFIEVYKGEGGESSWDSCATPRRKPRNTTPPTTNPIHSPIHNPKPPKMSPPPPNTNPTILIIPGSFAPASIYDPLVALLKERGFPAVALALPSTQKRMPLPPATLEDDAGAVRGVAEVLVGLGREVVVSESLSSFWGREGERWGSNGRGRE